MIDVRRARVLSVSALAMALTSGCSQASNLVCDPTLEATGQAVQGAMTSMITASSGMRAAMAVACAGIVTDLGGTPPAVGDGTMVTDAVMQQACTMAQAAITKAGTTVLVPEGGSCQVDAQAQFNCESQCDVTHMCTTPTVVARCTPAELSGTCSGDCEAMAVCEGSATVMANCQGSCAATCTGTCTGGDCAGTCAGAASTGPCSQTCVGQCAGTCTGTCDGDCTIASGAMVTCGAEATCRGGCSVAYTQPFCEATLNPPKCTLNANCEAACEGQGSFSATCTPPGILVVSSTGSTMLQATLQKNLPAILNVIAQGKLVAQAAVNVAGAAQNLATQLEDSAACAVIFGAEFATQVQAAVAASTTITVSVQASVSVSGAVVGG